MGYGLCICKEKGRRFNNADQAKRKAHGVGYDKKDDALEAARYSPLSMNNQLWRFRLDGDSVFVYCKKQRLLKKRMIAQNHIDIGIALGQHKDGQ